MAKRLGKRTIMFQQPPAVAGYAAIVGEKEGEGPLGKFFDVVSEDSHFGQKSWELAESEMQKRTIALAIEKAKLQMSDLDCILAGDLLNQCVGSSLASVEAHLPYLGLYGACSTMAQGLAVGAALMDGGALRKLAAAASSHFCSAERQYRFPLAYGGQRPPTAQWTATAAGAVVLAKGGSKIRVTHAVFGEMVDMGVKDANNMGSAMAPESVNLDPWKTNPAVATAYAANGEGMCGKMAHHGEYRSNEKGNRKKRRLSPSVQERPTQKNGIRRAFFDPGIVSGYGAARK